MNVDQTPGVGGLVISEDVIAKIAGTAAMDIKGVASLVARPSNVRGFVRREQELGAVRVTAGDLELTIDLHLRLQSGARIPDVSEAVQQAVKENVQNMTGKAVSRVNVHIEDIQLAAAAPGKS